MNLSAGRGSSRSGADTAPRVARRRFGTCSSRPNRQRRYARTKTRGNIIHHLSETTGTEPSAPGCPIAPAFHSGATRAWSAEKVAARLPTALSQSRIGRVNDVPNQICGKNTGRTNRQRAEDRGPRSIQTRTLPIRPGLEPWAQGGLKRFRPQASGDRMAIHFHGSANASRARAGW